MTAMPDPSSLEVTDQDRHLWKTGGVLAIVGGVVFMTANVLHPRSSDISVYKEQIDTVAASDIWIADHLLFLAGGLLILLGLYAFGRSISGDRASTWARFGAVMAVVSTSVLAVLAGIDGIASKFVHDSYASASGAEKATALQISEMLEQVDVALFSIWIVMFFGLTFLFFGLAVVQGNDYPAWLGWSAIVLALASMTVGTVQAFDGLSVATTNVSFVGVASLLNIWIIVMGWYLWRRGKD